MMPFIIDNSKNLGTKCLTYFFGNEEISRLNLWDKELNSKSAIKFFNEIFLINIVEEDSEVLLEFAIPGMTQKDFRIEVKNGMLFFITPDDKYKEAESRVPFGNFFQLPENCNPRKIKAEYENEILKIEIQKSEKIISNINKEIVVFFQNY